MELQQLVALGIFLAVYVVFSTRLIQRALVALCGALGSIFLVGAESALGAVVPEVLLATAGLMVLAGFVKRSGLASWMALLAARTGRGSPSRILVLTGLLTFFLGALFGPGAAIVLAVPVALLLAVELDVPVLPFVVVLSWTSLLGGATVLTALPGNLWMGSTLGLDLWTWTLALAPYTLTCLVVTLVLGVLLFSKHLRVTNERRARVLEYDAGRSLDNRPLLGKTLAVLVPTLAGVALAPALGLAPSVVILLGAALLVLWDGPGAVDRSLADLDGATLLFFGSLFAVVGLLGPSGWAAAAAQALPSSPWALLWGSAVLGAFVDHGAVAGASLPLLQAWGAASPDLWISVALGSTLGAGATIWGSAVTMAALGLATRDGRKPSWSQFSLYGVPVALANLAAVSLLTLVL